MNSIKEEIAKNLLYYRKKSKITQRELAVRLGVKHNTISGWESGINSVDIEMLFNICKILNISLMDIYGQYAETDEGLTLQEKECIKKYRELDQRGKYTVDMILDHEYNLKQQLSADSDIDARLNEYRQELIAEKKGNKYNGIQNKKA